MPASTRRRRERWAERPSVGNGFLSRKEMTLYGREIALPRDNDNAKTLDAESILIDRFQAGDVSAFEDLFTLYRDIVYRLAHRLLGEREEALDLSQEVFL